jgi:hypothetical protein
MRGISSLFIVAESEYGARKIARQALTAGTYSTVVPRGLSGLLAAKPHG